MVKTIRVLAVAHSAGADLFGSERSFVDACQSLHKNSIELVIALPSLENEAYVGVLATIGTVIRAPPERAWSGVSPPSQSDLREYYHIIWKYDIDCVYCNTILCRQAAYAGLAMSRMVVTHVRELIEQDARLQEQMSLSAEAVIEDVVKRSSLIVSNSQATHALFNVLRFAGKSVCIPNAVDHRKYLGLSSSRRPVVRVGIISSNSKKKGIPDFVKIAHWCHRRSVGAEFYIIGPINDRIRRIQDKISSGLLPENIRIVGYVANSVEAVNMVDLVLSLSSFGESFGRSVAEAMAGSRIVIAYDVGALHELVDNGKNGFLVPAGDFRAVASLIKSISEEPDRFDELRRKACEKIAASFSMDVFDLRVGSLCELIRKKCPERARRGFVTVVITVHNAFEHFERCLEAVIKTVDPNYTHIVIVNDGSTDPRVAELIKTRESSGLRGIHISDNVAYTTAVNIGITAAFDDDVVILNSDTIPAEGWLEALIASAYSDERIATVTPLSNNAGAFSCPDRAIDLSECTLDRLHQFSSAVLTALANEMPIDVPTGSGFCMFIKRSAIRHIGLMDNISFPQGYGEENDFCQRALRAGWRNVFTPWAYVFHSRSASFGSRRVNLVDSAKKVLSGRYPMFFSDVKESFGGAALSRWNGAAEDAVRFIKMC